MEQATLHTTLSHLKATKMSNLAEAKDEAKVGRFVFLKGSKEKKSRLFVRLPCTATIPAHYVGRIIKRWLRPHHLLNPQPLKIAILLKQI